MNRAALRRPGEFDIRYVKCNYSDDEYCFWTLWRDVDFWQWEIDDEWTIGGPFPLLPPIMGPCVPPRHSHAR